MEKEGPQKFTGVESLFSFFGCCNFLLGVPIKLVKLVSILSKSLFSSVCSYFISLNGLRPSFLKSVSLVALFFENALVFEKKLVSLLLGRVVLSPKFVYIDSYF